MRYLTSAGKALRSLDTPCRMARHGSVLRLPLPTDHGESPNRPTRPRHPPHPDHVNAPEGPGGRLIVALDVDERGQALRLVDRLGDAVAFYKVGWQLFIGEGFPFVRELKDRGKRVFLDLKMDDIEATVRAAVGNLKESADFLTIHGTAATVRAARAGRGDRGHPRFLMVTALSSIDTSDVRNAFANPALDVDDYATAKAGDALDAGCDGLIASGRSVRRLRSAFPERDFVVVAPGIRPEGAGADDHKRSLTPLEAVRDGADYLVVGRPIRDAPDPAASAARIIDGITRGLTLRTPAR